MSEHTQGADFAALTRHLHRALVNDGWQGHPDPLTDDDVLAIAETAAAALLFPLGERGNGTDR